MSKFDEMIKDNTLTPYQALLLISLANISDKLDVIASNLKKPETVKDDKHPVTNFEMYLQTK